jgi:hypothetical protein
MQMARTETPTSAIVPLAALLGWMAKLQLAPAVCVTLGAAEGFGASSFVIFAKVIGNCCPAGP